MSTITLDAKVKYKRKKNPRRFNIWDNEVINKVLQPTIDIHHMLKEDDEAEMINVDAVFMHDLCASYIALYAKALDESLILTANPKGSTTLN